MMRVSRSATRLSHLLMAGIFATLLFAPTFVVAAQNSTAISQGFQTNDKDVTPGAIVSLEESQQGIIHLANNERVSELAGVVADKPLIELSSSGKTIQVVTSGVTKILVSDINGDVKAGDKITASPINGVGMKATSNTQIVGIAQADLASVNLSERTIEEKNGSSQRVNIGLIPAQINISYYVAEEEKKTIVPSFLQEMANSIAGKDVSLMRIIASVLLLLLGIVSISVLLSSSIRSSIISIGRNPLSENAVHKSLLEVGGITIGILLVMLIAIYLILTI